MRATVPWLAMKGISTMKLRLASLALLVALFAGMIAAPMAAHAKPAATAPVPVTGTLPGGTFTGAVSNLVFSKQAGDLVLSGVLNGTATIGGVVTTITNQVFSVVVTPTVGGATQILFLDLGPIFLDVLGLQVDLSRIVLDITAVPGAGNLLGNLLSAVAGLLDGPSPLGGLAGLLNNLLRQLLR